MVLEDEAAVAELVGQVARRRRGGVCALDKGAFREGQQELVVARLTLVHPRQQPVNDTTAQARADSQAGLSLSRGQATAMRGGASFQRAEGSLPARIRNGSVAVRRLLPDAIPGMEMDRIEIPPRATLIGIPHTPGTREYLTCETGEITLRAAGEAWRLKPGDVLAFPGDQRHSYHNAGERTAVGYSVVVLARVR